MGFNIDSTTILVAVIVLIFLYFFAQSRMPKGTPINQFEYHAITFDRGIDVTPIVLVVGLILIGYILTKKVSI